MKTRGMPTGVDMQERHRLTVALSDDGESWHRVARVDGPPPVEGEWQEKGAHFRKQQFQYPVLLERDDSLLVGTHGPV